MERLFAAIPQVLNSLGPSVEVDEALALAAWKVSAGELLSQRTAAIEFFEDRLVVAVADETWRRHLEELAPQLLYKLNSRLEGVSVKYIEFVVDAWAISGKTGSEEKLEVDTSGDLEPSLTDAANVISDERLRKQFIDTAAAYLARQGRLK